MPRHVFLSPHLDDAVLSCGGTIHHLTQQEVPVLIHNTMAGDPPNPLPDSPLVRELHERWQVGENPMAIRRQEDEAAAQVLGASVEFAMELPDCIYRTANGSAIYVAGDDDLFGEIAPDDPAHAVLEKTPLPAADYLYVPLGVGHHVDHQLVRDWVLSTVGAQRAAPLPKILFYEDYPYAENEQLTIQTLHLPVFKGLRIEPDVRRLKMADFDAKCTAITKYWSQLSTFWRDWGEMRSQMLAFMLRAGNGELAERYWRIVAIER